MGISKSLKAYKEKGFQKALEEARNYLKGLGLVRYKAILFGSYARGDFSEVSDIDLLIISDELPENLKERLDFLFLKRDFAPRVEPIGWTKREYELRKEAKDPFIELLEKEGIVLWDNL